MKYKPKKNLYADTLKFKSVKR